MGGRERRESERGRRKGASVKEKKEKEKKEKEKKEKKEEERGYLLNNIY